MSQLLHTLSVSTRLVVDLGCLSSGHVGAGVDSVGERSSRECARTLRVGVGAGGCGGAGVPRSECGGGRAAAAAAAVHARVLRLPGAEHAEVRARLPRDARLPRGAHRAPDAPT